MMTGPRPKRCSKWYGNDLCVTFQSCWSIRRRSSVSFSSNSYSLTLLNYVWSETIRFLFSCGNNFWNHLMLLPELYRNVCITISKSSLANLPLFTRYIYAGFLGQRNGSALISFQVCVHEFITGDFVLVNIHPVAYNQNLPGPLSATIDDIFSYKYLN